VRPRVEGTCGPARERLGGVFAGAGEEVREEITRGTCAGLLDVPPQAPGRRRLSLVFFARG
jgi:hypothetical protein